MTKKVDFDKYFYKTIIKVAVIQGYTLKELALICDVKADTLSRRLQKSDGSNLTMQDCLILRDTLAPHLTLDELFPEASMEAAREMALQDTSL